LVMGALHGENYRLRPHQAVSKNTPILRNYIS
jgi:hypothetical protein